MSSLSDAKLDALVAEAVVDSDLRSSGIVAVSHRGRLRQAIGILDLLLPDPVPDGAQWIEAYRWWVGTR